MNDADPSARLSAFLELLQGPVAPIQPERIGLSLAVALGVGIGIAWIYAVRGPRPTHNTALALVGLTLVTALVILPVSSDLTLSLGMVGALSIVRFRAAIKDPLDIVFMFWAIAVGIASGAGFFGVAILGSVVIGVVLLGAGVVPLGLREPELLIVRFTPSASDQVQAALPRRHQRRSRTQDRTQIELVIQLRGGDAALLDRLLAIEGVVDAQLLSTSAE